MTHPPLSDPVLEAFVPSDELNRFCKPWRGVCPICSRKFRTTSGIQFHVYGKHKDWIACQLEALRAGEKGNDDE